MSKQQVLTASGIAVVALVIGFFGGVKYQQSKTTSFKQIGNFQNGQTFRGNGTGSGTTRRITQGNFVSGEILSKDQNSITVQLPNNGGSKIVLYSPSTVIVKSATSTADDLQTGKSVMITGKDNSDGSITAENIQIRNAMPQNGQTPPPGQ